MKIKISDYLEGNVIFSKRYPLNFKTRADFDEHEQEIENKGYKIFLKERWFEGIHISHIKINTKKPEQILIHYSSITVSFLYCLEGTINCENSSKIESIVLNKNQQIIKLNDFKNLVISFNSKIEYIHIQLTQEHYKKLTGGNFGNDLSAFESSETDSEITLILNSLITQKNHKRTAKISIQAKVYALLTFYINKVNYKPLLSLKKDDIDKILFAKKLVEDNIQMPYSLINLSRKAGINDYKLKKGFKEITGNTVFGYLYKIRMEKAHYYLSRDKKTVNEVAFLVGYKNAQHFTAAFKKIYNILPRSLNK
ncbi:helix-turn-helix transcriptional regulator [Pedobacter mendelii]|uniref:helix-turn-helix transcriptional regulator n=1 Tax=Pedobacter mendelii TaxID=1908240 RepID=UPI00360E7EAC